MTVRGSGYRILLVDDDQIVLDAVSYGLTTAGYVVETADNAAKAIATYREATPDLAIVDIELPDMGGTALAETLLSQRYRPILILSSHSEPEWVDRAINSGVIGYLVKPLTVAQLVPSIETALARFGDLNERIAKRLGVRNRTEERVLSAMDAFSFGIVIIDDDHRIIYTNSIADKLIMAERLTVSRDGKLRSSTDSKAFTDMLSRCLHMEPDLGVPLVSLIEGKINKMQLWGSPLPGTKHDSGKSAIVIINDPSMTTIAPSGLLKTLYGFTEKEAQLAHAMANGITISQYCESTFISTNTARTHLKSIYRKTATNRQADLIRLLSGLFFNLPQG